MLVILVIVIPVLIAIICYVTIEFYSSRRVYKNISDIPNCLYALVLGTCPYRGDGQPNRYFVYRMDAAAELYLDGKSRSLILSGDKHGDYDEPAAMAEALFDRGILKEALIIDDKGYDTIDSILFAKRSVGAEGIIILSQDYHCKRAVFLAGCCGIDAVAYCAKSVDYPVVTKSELREVLARVKAFYDVICIKLNLRK